MAKYVARTQFIVNGVDMSEYVNAVEVRMESGNVDMANVSLVGARLNAFTNAAGQNVITVSIGDE